MPAARPKIPRPPSVAEQHSEWLSLVRPEGPFLALPVLADALPQGLEEIPKETRARVRQAWAELAAAPDLLGPRWQELILTEVLRYPKAMISSSVLSSADFRGLRPDALLGQGGATRMHLYRRAFDEQLTTAVRGQPALTERAAQVCRDTRVPLALLTNGRLWVLVHARPGETTSTAVFDADLWSEEPALLRALASLCVATRVLPAPTRADGTPSTSLAALFARSAEEHAHVTTTLGNQVRQAVELLVAEIAFRDRESGGVLLADVPEREIYRGALTVLMRLVFLLSAEEQRLLPVTDPIYALGYAVSTLHEQLTADRSRYGDEVADRSRAAWPRLLALFAAIHGGCEHPDLRIPAYGGSLFDPRRYPWLEAAEVSDQVMHEILDALLVLKHRGKAPEQLSYARLGVEQIGHVYEGLLEFSCKKVAEPYVGLRGKLEPELPLSEVEALLREDELRARCDATPKQFAKWLAAEPTLEQMADLRAAFDNDDALAERARPFWGLLRQDLRGKPTIFPAGSVLFTQVGDRRSTGTHYTPRKLAEEVVEHTLAPLCFDPGPAQGAELADWRVKPAADLLKLNVVDPAMGSGAFLVSACRYLAERLVQAWERDGVPDDVAVLLDDKDDREGLLLAARRLVAARCLYGVDRDDMAVELAKLSLWLVTLAKDKPFGFLDHALRCGDSLIGLLNERQLVSFHLDASSGQSAGTNLFRYLNERIDLLLSDAADLRREIEASVVQDARDAAEKAELLANAEWMTRKLRIAADAVVGAALSTVVKSGPWYEDDPAEEVAYERRLDGIADQVDALLREEDSDSPVERELKGIIGEWLRGPRPEPIRPLHWPLEFPEVMSTGGFDAVVGNPPFIGGQRLTGAIGKDVREYLVEYVGKGKRGSADLCSYFLLRNVDISLGGRVGIIATNTIAQGDTREVGLDQVVAHGRSVYRAVKSQPWPGTASLEVSLVWVGDTQLGEAIQLDGRVVHAVTPSLDARSRVSGNPYRLAANAAQSFQGSNVLGKGFMMSPAEAQNLIEKDAKNKDVLFPYLGGEDLNSKFDGSASRWVINFRDWNMETAQQYKDCFAIVEEKVKPGRLGNNRKIYRDYWWQYAEKRPALQEAISDLSRMLVIARVSRTGLPIFVSTGQVVSEGTVVFAVDRDAYLALLSSNLHFAWWTNKGASTLRTDARYTPSDGFETFPQPVLTERMDRAGEELDTFRRSVMLERQLGLTKLYNLVHNESNQDSDIVRLREIHTEIDLATAEAYGWADLDLGHGFHQIRQGQRFTIAPDAQTELLDLLLELNFERHAEEERQGLHRKKKTKPKRARKTTEQQQPLDGLFAPDGSLF
ncbi:Eco57I restriction-modification methylase domain-containing protein [Amycolatopsis sp. NPDC058986]|uniref:Eco57I restriction-modification methylase domain-containing protein n=1 Tax=unclassified Amycolatopsis TaxID=2618356 RepID=UPI00366EB6F3